MKKINYKLGDLYEIVCVSKSQYFGSAILYQLIELEDSVIYIVDDKTVILRMNDRVLALYGGKKRLEIDGSMIDSWIDVITLKKFAIIYSSDRKKVNIRKIS